ncbi:MAG TPA: alpha/beta fold hydrolase [Steroidobacteraceae bacterium]|jgi:pimeloyl-ACP methyl ester carboxylesterase
MCAGVTTTAGGSSSGGQRVDAWPDGTASIDGFLTDSGISLPDEGRLDMAVEIHFPRRLIEPAVILACLPGGGASRRFFDLMPPGQDGPREASFSFARQMAARGFIVALIDHLGIGDSARPKDGFALSGDVLSQATHHVLAAIEGRVQLRYGAAPVHRRTVGVGHSMGALVTVLQQAQHRSYDAIALLGFSTRGLPDYVPRPLHSLARDPNALRTQLPALAKQMFKEPYPYLERTPESRGMFAGDRADARGIAALNLLRKEPILPLPSWHSMLPGNVGPEAASIDVPVFLGIGDHDIVGPPEEAPSAFPHSPDVELHVMPQTGHSLFLFAARPALFAALDVWARSVAGVA